MKKTILYATMHLLRLLPLSWLRAVGACLGVVAFGLAKSRRHIVLTNLRLCFPNLSEAERVAIAKMHFKYFMQAALDRAWLWHSPAALVRDRLRLVGDSSVLTGADPVVLFAPHFVGMDAAGMAVSSHFDVQIVSIYTPQTSPVVDEWMQAGRTRFGNARVFSRYENIKSVALALRGGERLFLLPDMDFGLNDAVFAPFFGVPAATLTSLSGFARLGRAKVVTVFASMTASGYDVHIDNDWQNFPSGDAVQDATRMNQTLQNYITQDIAQYYWVHKRFKTRPTGTEALY